MFPVLATNCEAEDAQMATTTVKLSDAGIEKFKEAIRRRADKLNVHEKEAWQQRFAARQAVADARGDLWVGDLMNAGWLAVLF